MVILNHILVSLLLSSKVAISTFNADEVVFPILKNIDLSFLESFENKHQVQRDVNHVKNLNSIDKHYRLHYNDTPVQHHLNNLDFIGNVEKYNCSENCFDVNTRNYKNNYTAEKHYVVTDDGYNLTLHRISGSPNYPKLEGKEVVYIQHGLFLSTDAYVTRGPKYDLAYMLADLGFDVWLGNARGNSYSRSHKVYSIESPEFWNFSFHEIGEYDLRTFIDYILIKTGRHNLNYIGYSIGATESYVLLSKHKEYNNKIRILISVSPLAFWQKPTKDDVNAKEVINKIKTLEAGSGSIELYPQSSFMQHIAFSICERNINICKNILGSFFGEVYNQFDNANLELALSHVPAGTSSKTLLHLLEIIESGSFKEFNTNKEYDLTQITCPNTIYAGKQEHFVYAKDVYELLQQFPSVAVYNIRPNEYDTAEINALDFPWGANTIHLHAAIINLLSQF